MRYVAEPIVNMHARDIIDVLLLALVLYELFRFAQNRRAGRVTIGLLILIFALTLVKLFHFPALSYISDLFSAASFFCIVVIYQPEIRDALERIGNSTFLNPRSDTLPRKHLALAKITAEEITDAVFEMAERRTGSLIVMEGLTKLGDYIQTGKIVDARVTSLLLQNIFHDKAPLHDGALVIRDMRIWAASCVLPSSSGEVDFGNMGTRHRAAVGVTEVSDALVVIVSEETGIVSLAQDGKLLRNVDRETLYDVLMTYLAGRLYLRTKRGVHVNPFDRVPLYNHQDEEESDLMDMGQISIVEEENVDFVPEEEATVEDVVENEEAPSQTEEETDKDESL
jgi:diadenylate cyclase